MNFIQRVVSIVLALLAVLGLNYFFNPPMNEKQEEEYWAREDALLEAKLRTHKIQERISDKSDKLNTGGKSLIDKAREEWDKE